MQEEVLLCLEATVQTDSPVPRPLWPGLQEEVAWGLGGLWGTVRGGPQHPLVTDTVPAKWGCPRACQEPVRVV